MDITKAFVPVYYDFEMMTEWLVTLEVLEDTWDDFDLSERNKLEQNLFCNIYRNQDQYRDQPIESVVFQMRMRMKMRVEIQRSIFDTTTIPTTESDLTLIFECGNSHSQA